MTAGPTRTTRVRTLPGLSNIRDAQNLRGPGGRFLRPELLLRGPAPPNGMGVLVALGVRTVVDLRTASERSGGRSGIHGGGDGRVHVLHRPVQADTRMLLGPPWPGPGAYLAHYRLLVPVAAPIASEVVALVAAGTAAPIYVCCTAGKDRTGVVLALALRALDVRLADIARDYALTARAYRVSSPGTPPLPWAASYGQAELAARTASLERTIRALVHEIEQTWRSVRALLEHHGLPDGAWQAARTAAFTGAP